MASADAVLNLVVSGSSKIDKLINNLSQLESIVGGINRQPVQINSESAQKSVDRFSENIKVLEDRLKSSKSAIVSNTKSINSYFSIIDRSDKILAKLTPGTKRFDVVMERRKNASDELAKSLVQLGAAEKQVQEIEDKKLPERQRLKNEAVNAQKLSRALENLVDDYLQLGIAQQRGVKGIVLKTQERQSIAQLNSQAQVLGQIAANSKIGSQQFNKFTIASQIAGQAAYNAQQQQLKALAFGLSGQAPKIGTSADVIPAARQQVGELISSYSSIVKSEAAMGAFYTQAKQLQSLVPHLSNEFRALEEVLARVDQDLADIGRRGQFSAINPQKGPAVRLDALQSVIQRANYEKRITDEASKQDALAKRIERAALNEIQKKELRNQLDLASTALGEKRIDDAQRLSRQIDRERFSMERANKVAAQTTKGGTYRTGLISSINAEKIRQNTIRSGEIVEQSLLNLKAKGVDVDKNLIALQSVLNNAKKEEYDRSAKNLGILQDQVAEAAHYVNLQNKIAAGVRSASAGGKGGAGGTGLEQALQSLREARGARLSFFGDASPAEAIDKIVREFNGSVGDVKAAADNVTTTLATELKAGSPKAEVASGKIAEGIRDGINNGLGIASPSKFIIHVVQILVKTWEDELRTASPRLQLAAERAFGLSGPKRMSQKLVNTIEGAKVVPSTNYRQLPTRRFDRSAMGPEGDAMMRRFRDQIAALTSQPQIYGNLLNALPNSRISTALADAANQRIGMTENFPGFLPRLRRIEAYGGPRPVSQSGIDIFALENEIKKTFSQYLRDIKIPNPWIGPIGDYREFIKSIEIQTKQLVSQPLLTGSRIAGALPPATQTFTDAQKSRIERAYQRSAERGLSVLSGDAFGGSGQRSLRPFSFGFAADPARISNLMNRATRGRLALPGGIDVQASTVETGSRNLRAAVRSFFERIVAGVASAAGGAFGGGGGGGTRRPVAGGGSPRDPGDLYARVTQAAQQGPQALLGLEELRNFNRVTINELNALSAVVTETRANMDPLSNDFRMLDRQLRNTIARIDAEQQRRAPEADLLTRAVSPRVGTAVSEGLIGGAFPLLFGQGVWASLGGGIGGAIGGFAGNGLGFGLSLLGTYLGTAYEEAEKFNKELVRVNASASGIGNTSKDVDSLASSLGIAKEEAVKLLEEFKQFSSGKIRKDLAFIFGGGRQAILERLESVVKEEDVLQGIVIARKEIGNEEALSVLNTLKISGGIKAQLQLQEALLRIREKEVIEQKKQITLQDYLIAGFASGEGRIVDPKIFGQDRATAQQKIFDKERTQRLKNIEEALKESQEFFRQVDQLSQNYSEAEKNRKNKNNKEENQLNAERARQAEQFARNQIELDNAVFKNKMELANQEFELYQRIASLQDELLGAKAFGGRKEIIGFLGDIAGIQRDYQKEIRAIQQEVAQAGQELMSARGMISAQQAGVFVPTKKGSNGSIPKAVSGYQVTSLPGMRLHPVTGKMKMHSGVDIGTPAGTTLAYSIGGIVKKATSLGGYGKILKVQLDNGVTAFAAHLNDVLIKSGQRFEANQILARTGATGNVTGPHLHMEGANGGNPANPLSYLNLGKGVSGNFARGQYQVVDAEGGVAVATRNFNDQIAAKQKLIPLLQKERDLKIEIAVAKQTDFLRTAQEETNRLTEEIEKRKIRNRLAAEGFSQEIIDGEMRVRDIIVQRDEKLKLLTAQLEKFKATQNLATIATVESALADYDKKSATASLTDSEKVVVNELERKLAVLKAIRDINADTPGAIEAARKAAQDSIVSPREKVQDQIGKLRGELDSLVDPANQVIAAAGAISNAFSQSFKGIIDGTMTADQALAGFFNNIANHFLDMASQVISKWIEMTILNSVLNLFPGSSGGAGGGMFNSFTQFGTSGELPFSAGTGYQLQLQNANGNAFNANGILPFAKGGIVSSPTLFKFAAGAAMRTGVAGEAGPEAIMPLKRGPGGRLGVEAVGAGGGITVMVNVDAKGSSVSGNDTQANQLGRVIAVAVQDEIVKQKRPGGLLSQ